MWIEISPREPKGSDIVRRVERLKGSGAVIRRADGGWLIPIVIVPGRSQEEVVEDAARFLTEINDFENQTSDRSS